MKPACVDIADWRAWTEARSRCLTYEARQRRFCSDCTAAYRAEHEAAGTCLIWDDDAQVMVRPPGRHHPSREGGRA